MTLWWIGNVVLLVVILPVVVYLLRRRARARPAASCRRVRGHRDRGGRGIEGPRRRRRCC